MSQPSFEFENDALRRGFIRVAGVDEVGRGPLAGPVMAAAVVLNPKDTPPGLNDSKKLNARKRAELARQLRDCADISIGEASVAEIDEFNILQASHIAMRRALQGLETGADHALIDGHLIPRDLPCSARAVIRGDALSLSISAASIVAKMCRDYVMWDLAQHYPGYGWETNAGYPTKSHKEALLNLGVTPHHRRSFAPVHNILYQEKIVTP